MQIHAYPADNERQQTTAITFDTLAYSKALQKAGMSPEQADAMANAQRDALENMSNASQQL